MNPPITIVTGFLGSGKTTLLRHILTHGAGGKRVALIVNELGDIGFDGTLIEGVNVGRMIELTSGCICCSVGTDFLLAVAEIIDMVEPELIIVETTGVAEPSGLIRQIHAGDLALDAVVTLVDAAHIRQALELSPVAGWQLRAADFLVLNKCDLVTPAERKQVHALLREYNQRAALFETVQGSLDTAVLFGTTPGIRDSAPAATSVTTQQHLHDDRIGTLTWRSQLPLARERFEQLMQQLPSQIYRAKGFVHCTDAPWPSLVNFVCGRVDYVATRFKQPPADLNQLVFIGTDLASLEQILFAELAGCADNPQRNADWQSRREST